MLKARGQMLYKARAFFMERGVLEVDVPILSEKGSIDLHIDLIQATVNGKKAYLHSSPEYGMKKLLSEGSGDIYQISHVFRDSEIGQRHNPEFTMVEWYRPGMPFEELIEETLAFCALFIDQRPVEKLSYREAFKKYAGMDYEQCENRDYTFAFEIEPNLGRGCITVIYDFPEADCALAKTAFNGIERVAKRFEVFVEGYELANGYDELNNGEEQRKRLLESNELRRKANKPLYPIDTDFLEALEKGFADCCGVAVGFDRLMMLKMNAEHIDEVIAFAWK
jgi:lysyl-tRNA synthetase class 2